MFYKQKVNYTGPVNTSIKVKSGMKINTTPSHKTLSTSKQKDNNLKKWRNPTKTENIPPQVVRTSDLLLHMRHPYNVDIWCQFQEICFSVKIAGNLFPGIVPHLVSESIPLTGKLRFYPEKYRNKIIGAFKISGITAVYRIGSWQRCKRREWHKTLHYYWSRVASYIAH